MINIRPLVTVFLSEGSYLHITFSLVFHERTNLDCHLYLREKLFLGKLLHPL